MTLDGQLARNDETAFFTGGGDARRYETDDRIVLNVEITLFSQVLVPRSVARIDLVRVHRHIEAGGAKVFRIEADLSFQAGERAIHIESEIFDLKGYGRSLVCRGVLLRKTNDSCELGQNKPKDNSHTAITDFRPGTIFIPGLYYVRDNPTRPSSCFRYRELSTAQEIKAIR